MKKQLLLIVVAILFAATKINAKDSKQKTNLANEELVEELEDLSSALAKIPALNARIKPIGCKIDVNWKPNQYLQECVHPEANGRTVSFLKFRLPQDRDILLSEKVMSSLGYLARNAAMRQASKVQQLEGKSTKIKVKNVQLYEKYLLATNYMELRFTWDEPAEGYLVLESNENHSTLTGLILATPFATWEPAFDFNSKSSKVSSELMELINSEDPVHIADPETETFDHKIYPHICELSLLIGYGNGKDLMHRLVLDLKNSDDYKVLMTNALPTAIPFYEKVLRMSFVPVHRWDIKAYPETRRISIFKRPYYHYLYPGQTLSEEDGVHMYASPIDEIDMNIFVNSGRKRKHREMGIESFNPFGAKRVFRVKTAKQKDLFDLEAKFKSLHKFSEI
ncbi:MAG: hypothetical protein AB8G05_00850 [Oligoflexales bacterium]